MGLHRVENASQTDKAVSLHLYCPPFEECSTFNQQTGHKTKAKSTFWSIYGEKVSKVRNFSFFFFFFSFKRHYTSKWSTRSLLILSIGVRTLISTD